MNGTGTVHDLLAVLYVIWSAGSIIAVFASFIAMGILRTENAKGIAFLCFLASVGSMCGAIVVGN